MGMGAVVAVVAPTVLIPKEDFCKKIVNMRPSRTPLDTILNHIDGVGWYSQAEAKAAYLMRTDFERMMLFGEREKNRKYYSGVIWKS